MPKRSGPTGRDVPDFVIGKFDLSAGVEEWAAVGEIKGSKTDLDQPQVGRANKETPVEQAFRYAAKGKAGVEWIIVTNFREIRLYKNGYSNSYHCWQLTELIDPDRLFEFYAILRPDGLTFRGREPAALRAFRETISAGRDLTEGFYGLYKSVQKALIGELSRQAASRGLSAVDLYGKTHKLLNRILFIAFCEKHPAELVPHDTLRQVNSNARRDGTPYCYWRAYKELFTLLNVGGGLNGAALNAFNGGLFAHDPYFDAVEIPNELFTMRFRAGKGRRQSLEIVGIFGFDVYDFAEDLNVQALGAIFEQSLKDISKGDAPVRGAGEVDVTSQEAGGVYYTPGEITGHLTRSAFSYLFSAFENAAKSDVEGELSRKAVRTSVRSRNIQEFTRYSEKLRALKIIDPACGSGAFLVEALEQLHFEFEKVNRALSELSGAKKQRSLLDLDRLILRENLFGRDILPESVEITKLSIWLRTAKRNERLETLDQSITVGDTLRSGDDCRYDVVIGNPPWGAELEGWRPEELLARFPNSGSELDSYAIFTVRAFEMLKAGGILAFIVPNSWLTVNGYSQFRRWFLESFEVLEIANIWKVFSDVNHDASIVIARKRSELPEFDSRSSAAALQEMKIRAVERGKSESEKLRQLAEGRWVISHSASHEFQYFQEGHRFEVIYPPNVAAELDKIASRCERLDNVADVTVGIQVYHHTKVPKEFIRRRGFHSTMREGADWYPYVDANDVQRYYISPSDVQWLHYNDKLRDKRELSHYSEPRILVQQIFWQRLAAAFEEPSEPRLYLNTLFAVYNARDAALECINGLMNSRFVSGSYERRANRLFGDKFPKVSKIDLASIPIPKMSKALKAEISATAISLQREWQALRDKLHRSNVDLASLSSEANLADFGEFWRLSETDFRSCYKRSYGIVPARGMLLSEVYRKSKAAVDDHWHRICSGEETMGKLVQKAYGVSSATYDAIVDRAPRPEIAWALRA